MPYPIQSGLPIPRAQQGRVRGSKNRGPWGLFRLQVGQCLTVPVGNGDPYALRMALMSAAWRYGKRNNTAYTSRIMWLADGARVVRLWRTA